MTNERVEMDQSAFTVGAPDGAQDQGIAVPTDTLLGDRTRWRLLPIALLLASYGPAVARSIIAISVPGYSSVIQSFGGPLEQGLLAWFGPTGTTLASPVVALIIAAGVWMLTRALGAPRWAAAVASGLGVVMPLFGLGPDITTNIDEASFGAAMVVALAFTVRAVQETSPKSLAIAFVVVIIAAWLRPWAAWPAVAVLASIVLVTRAFEERPWCGGIAALCWGPGLFLAQLFGETNGFSTGVFDGATNSAARLSAGLNTTGAAVSDQTNWMESLIALIGISAPLVILAVLAFFGAAICWLSGDRRKLAVTSALIFIVFSLLGALGYGDAEAARLLLDPMLLGLASVVGLVAPAAIRRFRASRKPR